MPTRPSTTLWKASFLSSLTETGLVSRAANYAGVTRQTAYNARNTQNRTGAALLEAQAFAEQWDAALDQAADSAELEVRRRAMQGTEHIREVYRQGQKVSSTITLRYSDRLLMFLLQKLRPDTYGNPTPPIPHTCKHCGCNPRSEPSPEEIKGRQLLNAYTDRLIARAKAPKPEATPVNSDSQNQPLSVSDNVSNFSETLIPNFDSENSISFVSNVVPSFQNFDIEISLEHSPSNTDVSYPQETVDCHVGAHGRAPLPAPTIYSGSIDSLNQPLFVSNHVSSSTDSTPLQNPHPSITSQPSLPPLSRDFAFSGTATEGRGRDGGRPLPKDSLASRTSHFQFVISHSSFPYAALAPPYRYSPSKEWQVWYTSF